MVKKAKKTQATKIAKHTRKKTKRVPAKKAKAKKASPKSAASPLAEIPFVLGYAFYSRPSSR